MVGNYVLEPRGSRGPVRLISGGKDKQRFTVQLTVLADGTKLPLLIIFKAEGFHWLSPDQRPKSQKEGCRRRSGTVGRGTVWHEIKNRLPDAQGNHYPAPRKAVIITSPSATSCERCTGKHLASIWRYRAGGAQPKSILVWDAFTAHGTESVRQHATSLNTARHFIDGGLTSVLQPLDKVVNKVRSTKMRYQC